MRKKTLSRGIAVAAVAVLMAGCSSTLNTSKLETTMKADLAKKTGTTIKSVSCPSDIKIKSGSTFVCTIVTGDGKTHHARVTQTDDKGNVHYQVID